MSELSTPAPRTFDVAGLSESELTFIVNATFEVNISGKNAKLVAELQQRLVNILTGVTEAEAEAEVK